MIPSCDPPSEEAERALDGKTDRNPSVNSVSGIEGVAADETFLEMFNRLEALRRESVRMRLMWKI